MTTKGTVSKWMGGLILLILFLTGFGVILPDAQTSAAELTDAEVCAGADTGCFYNASRDTACTENNATSGDTAGCTTYNPIPFGGLFTTTGVVILIIMGAILLGVLSHYRMRK